MFITNSKQARGRNGWFKPATITVDGSEISYFVWFGVMSRIRGGHFSIYMELDPADAEELANELLASVRRARSGETAVTFDNEKETG